VSIFCDLYFWWWELVADSAIPSSGCDCRGGAHVADQLRIRTCGLGSESLDSGTTVGADSNEDDSDISDVVTTETTPTQLDEPDGEAVEESRPSSPESTSQGLQRVITLDQFHRNHDVLLELAHHPIGLETWFSIELTVARTTNVCYCM